jgi:hypothetical protein
MTRLLATTCLAAVLVTAVAASGARASHTAFEQVSLGETGGNAAQPTQFVGTSADGTRVILRTEESLSPSDTDGEFDLYERAGGITTHLSTGPVSPNAEVLADLGGMSRDGRHVFFVIAEALVASDTDACGEPAASGACADVYEFFDGTTTLISAGTVAAGATFAGASEDGSRVFFGTEEPLSPSDTDSMVDIYERAGTTTTLVTTGLTGGNGSFGPRFRGASADGTRVFFTTSEQLTSQDTDTGPDIYERVNSSTNLISMGPAGGNSGADAMFEGASRNGARAFFSTTEQLTSGDSDDDLDVYERSFGSTTLLSTGPAGGNGSFDATFKDLSDVGTRVLFESSEQLVSADTDTARDVYERTGGTTTLVSTGPAGGNGDSDAMFQDASSDGTRVVFGTVESLVASDTDSMRDLYERAAGGTTLVSTAPGSGNGPFEAFFNHMSDDGQRVFFETIEPLGSDTDSLPDVYERTGGVTTRISTGTGGGNGNFIAVFLGAADDGSRAFFNTAEVLAGTDGDTSTDVYVARTTDTYVRPKGATPMSVSLVLAYQQCTNPNRIHGPPGLGGASSNQSCAPPAQISQHLTVGTFDANQKPVQSTGLVSYAAKVGTPSTPENEADMLLHLDMNDVRLAGSLDDYAGELTVSVDARITDRQNGSAPVDPATVEEIPFSFVANCAATPDTGTGGTCAADTTANAVVPGAIKETLRSSWELGAVKVYDGGADGAAGTPGNTLFAVQGIFVP